MFRILIPTVLLPFWSLLANAEEPSLQERYAQTANSWERRDLIEQASADDPKAHRFLLQYVLVEEDWYLRDAAIEALSAMDDPEVTNELKKLATGKKKPLQAEGAILALAARGDSELFSFFEDLLGSRQWLVRRAAVYGLAEIEERRAIDALLATWEKEREIRVWIPILETLEAFSQQRGVADVKAWRLWWEQAREKFSFEDPLGLEVEQEGYTSVRVPDVQGVSFDVESRGEGLPLLVLPDYWYSRDYLQRYLRTLERSHQLLYLKLPGRDDFEPALPNAPNFDRPAWPIEKLVDAFEALRGQLVAEEKIQDAPIAILAHGLSCWVSMTYASRHPKRVQRQILISPYSGEPSWLRSRADLEKLGRERNDQELLHYAQSEYFELGKGWRYKAKNDREQRALFRKRFNLYFADTRDLDIGRLLGIGTGSTHELESGNGSFMIPQFKSFSLPRSTVPTLIIDGKRSLRTKSADASAVAQLYGGSARVVTFSKSSRMPFLEESVRFLKETQRFLGKKRR